MFLLYGARWYFRRNTTKTFALCEHCESFAKLSSYTASKFGHLYFIPLLPIKMNRRVHCWCSRCDMMVEYESDDHDAAVQSVLQQTAEIVVAMLDGEAYFRSDSDEVESTVEIESDEQDADFGPGVECLPMMSYLMQFLSASGKYEEIAKLIHQFESPDQSYNRAMLTAIGQELQGDFEDALASWRFASLHPDSTYYADQRYSGLLSYRSRHAEAIDVLKKALARDVSSDLELSLKLSLIDELRNSKQFAESVAVFDDVYTMAPELKNNTQLTKLYKKARKKANLPMQPT